MPNAPADTSTTLGASSVTSNMAPEKSSPSVNWGREADKLDVYVWDYCKRRGYHSAAKALTSDAGLPDVPETPLKTPQGFLFEYVLPAPCTH